MFQQFIKQNSDFDYTNQDTFENEAKHRYLVFKLGEEQFATPLLDVQEVVLPQPARSLPNMPEYFTGVINLRGQIVGIISLKNYFNLNYESESEMILVFQSGTALMAGIVDRVEFVAAILPENIERKPVLSSKIQSDNISGITTINEKMVVILDLKQMIERMRYEAHVSG